MISQLLLLLGLAFLGVPRPAAADTPTPGTLDKTFNSSLTGSTIYTLQLETVAGVPRIVAGGDLFGFDLLFNDGLNDINLAIAPFGNLGRIVYTTVPETLADGSSRLLVGGLFGRTSTQVAKKLPGQNIIRLNPDLSLDDSFDPGAGANNYVTAILPVPDGIVVGGQFTQFNKVDHAHIVKVTEAGTIDPAFNPTLAINDIVLSLAAQPNPNPAGPQGQILVAGIFTQVGGTNHNKLARLNSDGTVDSTFNPSFDNRVVLVTALADGKILVGGDFENVNGMTANHIARLNYDGTLDPTFVASVTVQPSGLSAPVAVNVITPLADGSGRMYLGGNFARVNGVTRNFLARINADGTLDSSFDSGKTIINTVQTIAEQSQDNRLLVGETRSQTDGSGKRPATLIRLYGDPVPLPTVDLAVTGTVARYQKDEEFIITREGQDLTASLSVYVTIVTTGQTGKQGLKYNLIPSLPAAGTIDGQSAYLLTFPANSATATVNLDVIRYRKPTSQVGRVTFTIRPDQSDTATYAVGASSTATIKVKGKK